MVRINGEKDIIDITEIVCNLVFFFGLCDV